MRHFQVLLLALLAVITVELGLVIVQRPMPTAQAGPSTTTAPATGLLDPHDVLKAQLDRVEKEVGEVRRDLAKTSQNVGMITPNLEKVVFRVNDDSKRLLMTCYMVANVFLSGPVSSQAKNKMDLCRAGWWKPDAFNNFDIPWGP